MKATKYLYGIAPEDGTVIGIVFPAALTEPLIVPPGKLRHHPTSFGYLGTADSATWPCITSANRRSRPSRMRKRYRAQWPALPPVVRRSTMSTCQCAGGTKFKLVSGYKSTAEIVLEIDRGKADGVCGYDVAQGAKARLVRYAARQPDCSGRARASEDDDQNGSAVDLEIRHRRDPQGGRIDCEPAGIGTTLYGTARCSGM